MTFRERADAWKSDQPERLAARATRSLPRKAWDTIVGLGALLLLVAVAAVALVLVALWLWQLVKR